MIGPRFLLGYVAHSLKSGVLYEASLQYLICIVRVHDSSTLPHAQRNKESLFLLESVLDSALKMKYPSEKYLQLKAVGWDMVSEAFYTPGYLYLYIRKTTSLTQWGGELSTV